MGPDPDEHEWPRGVDDHGHDRGMQRGNLDGLQTQPRLGDGDRHALTRIGAAPESRGLVAVLAAALLQRDQVGAKWCQQRQKAVHVGAPRAVPAGYPHRIVPSLGGVFVLSVPRRANVLAGIQHLALEPWPSWAVYVTRSHRLTLERLNPCRLGLETALRVRLDMAGRVPRGRSRGGPRPVLHPERVHRRRRVVRVPTRFVSEYTLRLACLELGGVDTPAAAE